MSFKTTYNNYSKSFTEKKLSILKNIAKKNTSQKKISYLHSINYSTFNLNSLINSNLKKYTTTIRKYHIFIINSIIFDQRIHKVAVFKNNLLWDESSEFLKRFYKIRESIERIPKISEYYENYTLFPPVYFGLEGLIIIIMNKWTKRKKKYLEYIEDHEEEKKEINKRRKDVSFEPLINPSLFNNLTSSKSNISKNTLDFSKLENEPNKKCLKSKINDYNNEITINNKNKKIEDISSLSFSEIINDLSSHYSIKINSNAKESNKDNNKKDKDNNNNKTKVNDKKYKKTINNNTTNKKINKKESINDLNANKTRNTLLNKTNNNNKSNNINKLSQKKNTNSPRKKIKISLNKKNNKFTLSNNNTNLIKRNNNNLPLPFEKYQKKFMNTENQLYKKKDLPINGGGPTNIKINNKGTIHVNTISNYLTEKNKIISNNLLQKEESSSIKKTS